MSKIWLRRKNRIKAPNCMTEQELRDIVFSTVREHGPEVARKMLQERADVDFEFMLAAAKHGHALVQAMHESTGATLH